MAVLHFVYSISKCSKSSECTQIEVLLLHSNQVGALRLWNNSTPVEPGPNGLAHTSAVMAKAADFFWGPPTLKASNFANLRPRDLILIVWKDLNPLSMGVKSLRGWQHFKD